MVDGGEPGVDSRDEGKHTGLKSLDVTLKSENKTISQIKSSFICSKLKLPFSQQRISKPKKVYHVQGYVFFAVFCCFCCGVYNAIIRVIFV